MKAIDFWPFKKGLPMSLHLNSDRFWGTAFIGGLAMMGLWEQSV